MKRIIPQWVVKKDNSLHLKREEESNTLCNLKIWKLNIYSVPFVNLNSFLEPVKGSCEDCYRIYLMEYLAK